MRKHMQTYLYIMKAYHIYEDHRQPKLEHMIDPTYDGYILFGDRDDGKYRPDGSTPSCAVSSAGAPGPKEVVGARLTYTIDTGMGYRCNGYTFTVTGWAKFAGGVITETYGVVPALTDKVNAFVMK